MPTFRIYVIVEPLDGGTATLPLDPVDVRRLPDDRWERAFDTDGSSFDGAAGQLWGELAACGVAVRHVASLMSWPNRPS